MTIKKQIDNFKNGSIDASKSIYTSTYKILYPIALRYMLDDPSSKDVLQETYLIIFKALANFQYKNETSTLAWMKRICANEAIAQLKKKKSWDNLQLNQQQVNATNNKHNLFTNDLYQLLLRLPERQRIVFNLFAIEAYSHKEIAESLGISIENSRTLVARARKFLANNIQKKNYVAI